MKNIWTMTVIIITGLNINVGITLIVLTLIAHQLLRD